MMCMNIEIASIIFEICIVPDYRPSTGVLLARDYSWTVTPAASFFPAVVWSVLVHQQGITQSGTVRF